MSNTKLLIGVGLLVAAGGAGYWYYRNRHMSPPLQPGAMPPSGTSDQGTQIPLYSVSPDIDQLEARLTPQQLMDFKALLAKANPTQLDMLESIAHSWNNSIPLTADQAQFWGTYGVF